MSVSVTMPALGESVTEGTITRWLKQEGDRIEVDEPLLEISTDKVDTEIPSPVAGVLSKIVAAEDDTVEVGGELAVIDSGDGGAAAAPAPTAEPVAQPAAEPVAEPAAEVQPTQPQSPPQPEPAATPVAGKHAAPDLAEGTEVRMPALGESVTEGTVTRWLKQEGESIEVDEPLLEISTDKVDTEIPSPVAGTLLKIVAGEDETVEVDGVLAIVGSGVAGSTTQATAPGAPEPPPAPAQPAAPPAAPLPTIAPQPAAPLASAPAQQAPAPTAPAAPPASPAPVGASASYVTPLVRKLAKENGVDLAEITGTGVGGRIRKQDILEAAARSRSAATSAAPVAQPAATAPKSPTLEVSPLRGTTEKLTRLRTVIAKRMVEALQTAAQLTTVIEVDVTRIAKLRQRAKADFLARHGVKLSFLPFFTLAAVEALRAHPKINSTIDMESGTVTYHNVENLGMAVDTERGLIVPVIHNAGDLNLGGMARKIADLAERTRDNKIRPDDIAGATFTLTNTGSRGALFDTAIFTPPQVAILATGAVVKRAVVVDDPNLGEIIVPRSMAYLALSYDHRIVDGADAARYLSAVKERLEAGQFESDLGL